MTPFYYREDIYRLVNYYIYYISIFNFHHNIRQRDYEAEPIGFMIG